MTWICAALSDADRAVARGSGGRPGRRDARRRRRCGCSTSRPTIFDRAYNNVANSTLWFVQHLLFDTPNQPRFGPEFRRDWDAYLAYNEAFADALADEAQSGPDPAQPAGAGPGLPPEPGAPAAAGQARRGGAARRIGHFSHTPWAPPGLLPDAARTRWAGRCSTASSAPTRPASTPAGGPPRSWTAATAILGAQVTRAAGGAAGPAGRVALPRPRHRGGRAPAGRGRRRAAGARRGRRRPGARHGALRRAAGDRKLIVRVDRTELSKNIVRGLAAYRELLATRPQWHGRVVHLAFAYPSRSALPEYRAYTDQVRAGSRAEITEEFGTPDWTPLILEVKDDYPRSLAACALADVLLVNPIRDGMNLVAQEGPVLSEHGCALVLSREAGAAATLADGALLVNPYDVSETADALHQALAMPDAERRRRRDALAATAAARPPARWLGDQLASLER